MAKSGELKINKPEKVQPGYILYSPYAGKGFVLIDREANIVHEWATGRYTKIAELLPNGRILYARMRDGVFEADWDNNVLWSHGCRQHHDFCRKPNGNTLVVCNEFNRSAYRRTICGVLSIFYIRSIHHEKGNN